MGDVQNGGSGTLPPVSLPRRKAGGDEGVVSESENEGESLRLLKCLLGASAGGNGFFKEYNYLDSTTNLAALTIKKS